MTPIVLDLPVNPIPQGRPRVTFNHRGVHAYKPAPVSGFYESFRWALKAIGHKTPIDGPLDVTFRFWRRCRSGANRGDLSNIIKACEDAGNGYIWIDDKQIIRLTATLESWGPKVNGRIMIEIRHAEGLAKEVNVKT